MRAVLIISTALLLVGFGSIAILPARNTGEPLPDTIYAWGKRLQFVSLERAVDGGGRIDTDLLPVSTASALKRALERSEGPNGCIETYPEISHDYPPENLEDIEKAILSSDNILIGRVVGLKVGFNARLGHLVAIETEESLKGSPNPLFYLFFPQGRFEFRGKKYCATHEGYPGLPEVEDRILVMHRDQIRSLLISVVPTQLVVLPKQGRPDSGKNRTLLGPGKKRFDVSFQTTGETIQWAKRTLREASRP